MEHHPSCGIVKELSGNFYQNLRSPAQIKYIQFTSVSLFFLILHKAKIQMIKAFILYVRFERFKKSIDSSQV
jgi:hypothetical protein